MRYSDDQDIDAEKLQPGHDDSGLDIYGKLKSGENRIKIRVANLIANEMWMKDDMNTLAPAYTCT